jgi:hypothetical protein
LESSEDECDSLDNIDVEDLEGFILFAKSAHASGFVLFKYQSYYMFEVSILQYYRTERGTKNSLLYLFSGYICSFKFLFFRGSSGMLYICLISYIFAVIANELETLKKEKKYERISNKKSKKVVLSLEEDKENVKICKSSVACVNFAKNRLYISLIFC